MSTNPFLQSNRSDRIDRIELIGSNWSDRINRIESKMTNDVTYMDGRCLYGQIHTFQKCIQNRPSTLRSREKQLFVFWPLIKSICHFWVLFDHFFRVLELQNIYGTYVDSVITGNNSEIPVLSVIYVIFTTGVSVKDLR